MLKAKHKRQITDIAYAKREKRVKQQFIFVAIIALLLGISFWWNGEEKINPLSTKKTQQQISFADTIFSQTSPLIKNGTTPSQKQIEVLAEESYIYGYPLVLTDVTKDVMTNTSSVAKGKAPINQFYNLRSFPTPSFTDIVSPNADTLYSMAWLDLTEEPIIISVPAMGDRYYLLELMDAWTNVFSTIGTRQTGKEAGSYAVVGPNWKGSLPENVKEIKSPTNTVAVIGRTLTDGPNDYAAVHKIQDQYKLTPLSHWGQDYVPPENVPVKNNVNKSQSPAEQVEKMDGKTFFARLAEAMKSNPPSPQGRSIVEKLPILEDTRDQAAVNKGIANARKKISSMIAEHKIGKTVNGWLILIDKMGNYGTSYLLRAAVAKFGYGANLAEDAVYPSTRVDSEGQPLNGKHNYVIHFEKGKFPPANAFWSITLYNDKQAFAENKIDRYAIGNRDPLKINSDGSLDIYIQNSSPGDDKESNWLPAPQENFNLIMRLYSPQETVLDGSWSPPPVVRVNS